MKTDTRAQDVRIHQREEVEMVWIGAYVQRREINGTLLQMTESKQTKSDMKRLVERRCGTIPDDKRDGSDRQCWHVMTDSSGPTTKCRS